MAKYITIHQSTYIASIVAEYSDSNPALKNIKTPADDKLIATQIVDALSEPPPSDDSFSPDNYDLYANIVDALTHCAIHTRPDIAYATGMLRRCLTCPNADLLTAAQRVLRYLEKTANIGLTYQCSNSTLSGMSDSDWALKHSTSG